jgi:hypothetical protein
VKLERGERTTAEPDPPPAPREDLLNRNIGRRYETPRRYETWVEVERRPDGRIRAERD